MRQKFIEVETREEAEKIAPWAAEIVECEGGFRAFESMRDLFDYQSNCRADEWGDVREQLLKENGGKGKLDEESFIWSEGINETQSGLLAKYWDFARNLYISTGDTIRFVSWAMEIEKIPNVTPLQAQRDLDEKLDSAWVELAFSNAKYRVYEDGSILIDGNRVESNYEHFIESLELDGLTWGEVAKEDRELIIHSTLGDEYDAIELFFSLGGVSPDC